MTAQHMEAKRLEGSKGKKPELQSLEFHLAQLPTPSQKILYVAGPGKSNTINHVKHNEHNDRFLEKCKASTYSNRFFFKKRSEKYCPRGEICNPKFYCD